MSSVSFLIAADHICVSMSKLSNALKQRLFSALSFIGIFYYFYQFQPNNLQLIIIMETIFAK